MIRPILRCLGFCVVGLVVPLSLLHGQDLTPVIPAPTASQNSSAIKIEKRPIASTPLEEAQKLYRMRKFDEAIQQYEAAIARGTDSAVAYAWLARTYLKEKRPNDAFSAAVKAVEFNPSLATAHSALGEVYLRQGKLYEAEKEFLASLKAGQIDAKAYLGLSRLYHATFNFKRAQESLDKAYALDPQDPDIYSTWIATRSRSERIQALERSINSTDVDFSRAERSALKHQLTMMKDQEEHPERICHLANKVSSSKTTLKPFYPNINSYPSMEVEIQINDQKSLVEIDTRGSEILITGELAKKAGVQRIAQADLDDLGDDNPPEGYVGYAKAIRVVGLDFENCYVSVVDEFSQHSFLEGQNGLVGTEIFSQFLVDLDIPKAKLELSPLPPRPSASTVQDENQAKDGSISQYYDRYVPPEMTTWAQLFRFKNLLLIPTRVNNSNPKLFDIGLAATNNFIAPQAASEVTVVERAPGLKPRGLNGEVRDVFITGAVRLQFGDFYFDNQSLISFDLTKQSEKEGTEVSGTLGFETLRNLEIKIDYRDGLVFFDNGQKRKR
jgi:tetratricopeptide (TPR) repeat protein